MANTSRYFYLSNDFLLEYIYDSDLVNTATHGFNKLVNNNDNRLYFSSSDSFVVTNDNIFDRTYTTKVRATGKQAFLNQDLVVPYNDFDPNLTDTPDLPVNFNGNDYNLQYDTIRIHFRSGLTFIDSEGFFLHVYFLTNGSYEVNVVNLVYLKTDTYKRLHDLTLLVGDVAYDSYIDVKIPSLKNLKLEQQNFPTNVDKLWYILTNGSGLNLKGNIGVEFGLIANKFTEVEQITPSLNVSYTFFDFEILKKFSINSIDEYEKLSAFIEEEDQIIGDYFLLQARYENQPISDYITLLNTQINSNWIVLHDINVFEQIGSSQLQTANYIFVQDSNFDDAIYFRPVIKNSNVAVSYTIQYTIRLFNRITNEQVIKKSQFISTHVHKYGRKLTKINLGINPTIDKIYNKINVQEANFVRPTAQNPFQNTKFVINYFDKTNIFISSGSGNQGTVDLGNQLVYGQNEGIITINDVDTYLKFSVYEQVNNALQNKNLNSVGEINITFIDNNNNEQSISQVFDEQFDPVNGEILFRISKEKSKEIVSFNNPNFYITIKNGNQTTILYTGSWITSSENNSQKVQVQLKKTQDTVKNLQLGNKTLQSQIDALKAEIKIKDEKITELQNQQQVNNTIQEQNNSLTNTNRELTSKERISGQTIKPVKNTDLKGFFNS